MCPAYCLARVARKQREQFQRFKRGPGGWMGGGSHLGNALGVWPIGQNTLLKAPWTPPTCKSKERGGVRPTYCCTIVVGNSLFFGWLCSRRPPHLSPQVLRAGGYLSCVQLGTKESPLSPRVYRICCFHPPPPPPCPAPHATHTHTHLQRPGAVVADEVLGHVARERVLFSKDHVDLDEHAQHTTPQHNPNTAQRSAAQRQGRSVKQT